MRLETPRLLVRDLELGDLDAVHRLLDMDLGFDDRSRDERARWLEWTILAYEQLGRLYQPPFGEYGVALRASGDLIGAVGFVPVLLPFGLLAGDDPYASLEMGLFWAIHPAFQRQGYAAEAARALIGFAFGALGLKRIVATTEYDNAASQAVMRRLGMRIERNPARRPFFMQVVGILDNPGPPPEWPK